MIPIITANNSFEFTAEEQDVLKQYLSSDVMRAYLRSTFAQVRDELLSSVSPRSLQQQEAANILATITGAEEFLNQILRIGESNGIS